MTKTETQEVLSKYQEVFFTAKWTEHQQMLRREVVESLSFDIFKRHLDTAYSSKWLCLSRGVGPDDLHWSLPTSTILQLKFPSYSCNEWPGDV